MIDQRIIDVSSEIDSLESSAVYLMVGVAYVSVVPNGNGMLWVVAARAIIAGVGSVLLTLNSAASKLPTRDKETKPLDPSSLCSISKPVESTVKSLSNGNAAIAMSTSQCRALNDLTNVKVYACDT